MSHHLQFGLFPLIRMPHCDLTHSRNGGLPSYGNWFLIPETGYVISVQKRSDSECDAETAEVAIKVPTEDGYIQYEPAPNGVDEMIAGGGILSYQSPQDILKLIVKLTRIPPLPHLDKVTEDIAKGFYPVIKQTRLPKHTEDGYIQYEPAPNGVDEMIAGGGILSYQSPQDILKLIVKLTRIPPLPHLDKVTEDIAKGFYPVIKQTRLPKHLVRRIHQRNRKSGLIKTPMTLRVYNYGWVTHRCPSFTP